MGEHPQHKLTLLYRVWQQQNCSQRIADTKVSTGHLRTLDNMWPFSLDFHKIGDSKKQLDRFTDAE